MHRHSPVPAAPIAGLSHHAAYLRARLRGLGVAESNLDDAMQDVFEVLVRRIGDFDARFSLQQWMAGVARKVARRHREQGLRAPVAVDEGRLVASVGDPERSAARGQGLRVLQRFLDGLDEDKWAVFVLSEIEGLRGTEIAAELEVNLSTVYARLRAARQAFEAAAVQERGSGGAWFAGWFVGPTSMFRRTGDAAFVMPVVLCGLVVVGGVGVVGARGCGEDEGEELRVSASRGEVSVVREEGKATGIAGREVDPAGVVAPARAQGGPPVPDAEGWYGGGGGRSETTSEQGTAVLLHSDRYRFEGADLVMRVEYENVGEVASMGFGWFDLDGFEAVEGATQWPTVLAGGEVRVMQWRLRARRDGVVRAPLFQGPRARGEGYGASLYRFVNEGGRLRRCGVHECDETIASIVEAVAGETIKLQLHNDCDRAIELAMMPDHVEVPPADAPRIRLAEGERREVEVDVALGFTRRGEDGHYGGSVRTDTPGSIVRFFGDDCQSRQTVP